MRPALIGLIISAFISLGKESFKDFKSILIGGIVLLLLLSKKINPIVVILISAGLGIVFFGLI